MIYFISDLHFGHFNIIRFDNRPFTSIEEMDTEIITNWNSKIKDTDTVYILGDVSWYNNQKTYEILKQLKGKKILIKGNHDKLVQDINCRKQFIEITDYKEIILNNQLIVLSHYPIMFWKNQWRNVIHLYGHVHVTQDYDMLCEFIKMAQRQGNPCRMYNVGCMMPYMNYSPKTLEEIINCDKT